MRGLFGVGRSDAQGNDRRAGDRGRGGDDDPAGVPAGRGRDRAFLLPRTLGDRRQLPDVPRRGREIAKACGVLRDAGRRGQCHPHPVAGRHQGAQRRHGNAADQSPARLPDLRSGRRVRSAGPGDGLRLRPGPLRGEQARRARQGFRTLGRDQHEPLHPLHALHPLSDRNRRSRGARCDRPRRGDGNHHLCRAGAGLGAVRQHRRSVPGRGVDLEALCLCRAALGIAQNRVGRRARRGRQQHPGRCPRRADPARAAAPPRGYQRRVDLRQDPLRDRRSGAAPARPALYPAQRRAGRS